LPGRLQQLELSKDRSAGPVNFSRWLAAAFQSLSTKTRWRPHD
jgi:hypothetical protein